MNVDDVIGTPCLPLGDIIELHAPVAVVVTNRSMSLASALSVFRAARAPLAERGCAVLLLGSLERLGAPAGSTESVDELFARRGIGELEARAERALDELADAAEGRDPLSVLHRVPADELASIEGGGGLDLDNLDLDDVAAAYREGLAWREQTRARAAAAGGPALMLASPLRTFDEDSALAELGARAAGVRVAVVEASTPAQPLGHLGFGAWNACPAPDLHAAVWRRWAQTVGAAPVLVDEDRLSGVVHRPVVDRAGLVRLAAEVAAYDGDALVEGMLPLLGTLYRNTSVRLWWD